MLLNVITLVLISTADNTFFNVGHFVISAVYIITLFVIIIHYICNTAALLPMLPT